MRAVLDFRAHASALRTLGVWLALTAPVAVMAGSASALFLWSLDRVTALRFAFPWLLLLLPAIGPVIVWLYEKHGRGAGRGTDLLLDEIHQPGAGVPVRMAPLVLLSTLLTHLFGGSAGREGTALQMGGGLAAGFIRWARIPGRHHAMLLQAGIAAGFGSVFGTPVAGAVFAIEVLAIGQVRNGSLLPCLFAGLIGDLTCSALGIHHTSYHIDVIAEPESFGFRIFDVVLIAKSVVLGAAAGLVAMLFSDLAHAVQKQLKTRIQRPWLRPFVGGLVVIGLAYALGTRAYLGLGVSSPYPDDVTILSCFHEGGATGWSWLWKILFTVVTLGSGFKGGEVTPLFFIGAALGNALSGPLGAPTDLLAGLGFVAVFAGASNTPLACTLMGIELFGAAHAPYLAAACFVAYLFSGHSGIYGSQRITGPKTPRADIPDDVTLADLRRGKDDVGRPDIR
jgi:H+/Cl- antiporter ClcA